MTDLGRETSRTYIRRQCGVVVAARDRRSRGAAAVTPVDSLLGTTMSKAHFYSSSLQSPLGLLASYGLHSST